MKPNCSNSARQVVGHLQHRCQSDPQVIVNAPESVSVGKESRISAIIELFKPRLTSSVLFTVICAFICGSQSPFDWVLLANTVVGSALIGCSAMAFNQWLERDEDLKMERTCSRPLPSGRVGMEAAAVVATITGFAGLLQLSLAVSKTVSAIGLITLGMYLLAYTPLKRITPWNTVIGAIPGALPTLMGWTAARGHLDAVGWSLFAILFFWQVPHFLAIHWMHRDEYAEAGFKMLDAYSDPSGFRCARAVFFYSSALFLASIVPAFVGLANGVYLVSAVGLGAGFLLPAMQFAKRPSLPGARRLFRVSVVYLPLLFGLLAVGRILN